MTPLRPPHAAEETEPLPISVPGKITAALIRRVVGEIAVALALFISVFGLADGSFLVQLRRFLLNEQIVPLITTVIGGAGFLWAQYQSWRRRKERVVMARLLPNSVAKVEGPVSAAIEATVEKARAAIAARRTPFG